MKPTWLVLWLCTAAWVAGLRTLWAAADYPYTPVPFTDVKVADGFWSPRLEANRKATVPACFKRCEETGRLDNFAIAGGMKKGEFRGNRYDDSDVFKVIEGAAYTLALERDPELEKYLDDLIARIAAAQEKDGYLYTCRTINPNKLPHDTGATRWSFLQHSHELYNAGHLYEAAVAYYQATGKRSLLNVAIKNADLIDAVFGPGKRRDVPGHEEIEIGLVKLYRTTGDARYLKLAKFFIDERGHAEGHKLYGDYAQDHRPVIEQDEPLGHAVRACYLYSGMADVAALTGDRAYVAALEKIWTNLVSQRLYLTGGIGAEAGHEGFGPPYELPNKTAYNETCAAVGLALWNHRLFLLHGDAKYLDVLERVIYNGFLSGASLSGDRFFYPNPLASDGELKFNHGSLERSPWFSTACCPVNVVRFVPSIAGYIYARREDAIYVNLFVAGTGLVKHKDNTITLRQETRYPWDGHVKITVEPQKPERFAMHVRIPGWALGRPVPSDLYHYENPKAEPAQIKVNGKPVTTVMAKGFARIEGRWKKGDTVELDLAMPIRWVVANERVKEDAGRVALERGPLVYCVEAVDNPGQVDRILLPEGAVLKVEYRQYLLGGVNVISGTAAARRGGREGRPARIEKVPILAVPYYAWDNRGPGLMAVWLPKE